MTVRNLPISLDCILCESGSNPRNMSKATRPTTPSTSGLLSHSRCRYVTYYLLETRHTDIETLSRQITAWERGESPETVSESARRPVRTSLIHDHLPRLDEDGLVEFDPRSGSVTRAAGFEPRREEIKQARVLDGDVGPVEEPIDSVRYAEPASGN
ncbi:DUF7344 domain-containing protein [Natronococcus occultus]|uniref:DUF7344 domain-containing protein n=1 Tax=Natronococcus occultus SP4 TaxID=694430 RepID=L0K3E3_9EURY|nr:hypothetical protein Natoc_3836 [Natronococcus occultus SP4]